MGRVVSPETRRRLAMQALVLLGIAVLVGGAAAFLYYVSLPYAGFEIVGSAGVGAVLPGGPAEAAGLQVGDHVLTVDGDSFRQGRAYLRPGQDSLRLTVSRAGQVVAIGILLAPPTLIEAFYATSHFLVALAFWLLAMAVLFLKPRETVAQMFALVSLLGAAAIVVWGIADLGLVWANLLMVSIVAATGPVFLHFHTLFPERQDFKGRKAVLAAAYGSGLVLWLLSIASHLMHYFRFDQGGADLPSLAQAVEAHFAICIGIGLMLLVRTYRLTERGRCKRQIALVWLGTAMALVPFITLIAVPQILSRPYPIPTSLTMLLLLLIPLSYAYAIFRHRLMDLDPLINRSVVSYLLTLLLLGVYLGLSLSLGSVAPRFFDSPLAAGNLVLVGGLVVLFGPLRQAIQRFVDRVFYGGWYDYETLISHASRVLGDTLSVDAIADLLVNDVGRIMRLKAAALLLPEGQDSFCMREGRGFAQPVPTRRDGTLAGLLLELDRPVLDESLRARLPRDPAARRELDAWSKDGARVWVPLTQQGELAGLLVLGGKEAGDFFYPRDYGMLTSLSHQAGVALARVRLIEELRDRVHEVQALARQVMALQERNQQQMAVEIHARLLQDLAVADLFLDDAEKAFRPEEVRSARDVLQEMARYLRTVLFELQPPAWDHSDLRTVLEDYIWNFQQRRGLPVALEVNGNGGGEMPEEVRIAVYRILQESLNNARKHAEAKQVQVSLDLQAEWLRLAVHDDGVGFDVPVHLGPIVDRGHLGLVSMRQWAQEVGGDWRVESQPGEGTRIVLDVPLTAQEGEKVK